MSWGIYGTFEVGLLSAPLADVAYTPTAYNAAAADLFVFTARRPMTVVGFGYEVTTTVNVDAVAQILSLDHRVTHNSNVGRVELATITLVDGWTDGSIKLNRFNGIDIDPGEQLVIECKTQGTSGGAATGATIPFVCVFVRPEIDALMTNFALVTS
jgi:hypothetical protein